MIVFFVCDNSGVKYIKVLNFLKGLKAQFSVGSFYNVLSKTFFRQSKVKKGLFYNGLLIRFAGWLFRFDGLYIRADKSSVVLFSKSFKFLGTRFFGPIQKELLSACSISHTKMFGEMRKKLAQRGRKVI